VRCPLKKRKKRKKIHTIKINFDAFLKKSLALVLHISVGMYSVQTTLQSWTNVRLLDF